MSYASFLSQIAPIFVCAAVMLLLRNARFGRGKIRITYGLREDRCVMEESKPCAAACRFLTDLPMTAPEAGAQSAEKGSWRGYLPGFEDMRRMAFVRFAYDSLLSNGRPGLRRTNPERIERAAYRKLGIVDINNLGALNSSPLEAKGPLSVFAMDRSELLRSANRPEFGLILARMINYEMGVCNESAD